MDESTLHDLVERFLIRNEAAGEAATKRNTLRHTERMAELADQINLVMQLMQGYRLSEAYRKG